MHQNRSDVWTKVQEQNRMQCIMCPALTSMYAVTKYILGRESEVGLKSTEWVVK